MKAHSVSVANNIAEYIMIILLGVQGSWAIMGIAQKIEEHY